jgi:hypothetical protein
MLSCPYIVQLAVETLCTIDASAAVLCPGETTTCDKVKIKAVVEMLLGHKFYSVLT